MKIVVKEPQTMQLKDVRPGQAFRLKDKRSVGTFIKIDPSNLCALGWKDNALTPSAMWLDTYPAMLCAIDSDDLVTIVNVTVEL